MKLDKFNVEFIEENHSYFLTKGKKKINLQGITGLLQRQLFPDKFTGIPKDVLAAAAARGTMIHKDLSNWFELQKVWNISSEPETDEGKEAVKLIKEKGLDAIFSEMIVSDGVDFASAIDMVLQDDVDGKYYLIDFKTSSILDREMTRWQLSIYRYFLSCMEAIPDDEEVKLVAIHTPKAGGANWVELDMIPMEECKALLQAEKEGKQYILPPSLRPAELVLAPQLIDEVHNIFAAIEGLKKRETELREQLLQEMMNNGVKSFKCPQFSLTVKEASTRTTLDTTALKKQMPEVYEQFKKESKVKESLIIKIA